MRVLHILVAAPVILLAVFAAAARCKSEPDRPVDAGGFAVLELFTSEGCSSCPPADALLARIRSETGDKPVYILAYHVDYWDHQGWKDRFSSIAFTRRQNRYSRSLSSLLYTPQLVVNGSDECIGSDEAKVRARIRTALGRPSAASLETHAEWQNGKLALHYTTKGTGSGDELLVAVVQKEGMSQVKRGENEGRTLSHVQIVRDLQTYPVSGENTRQIPVPAGFNTGDWELISFVQNRDTGIISAASRSVVTTPETSGK